MKSTHKIFVSILLLLAYVSYLVSTSVFVHVHNDGNEKIVHSHPFTSSNHSHTQSQLSLISFLSSAGISEGARCINCVAAALILLLIITPFVKYSTSQADVIYSSLRAPPAL